VRNTNTRGELVFAEACRMGLEGIVSKRLSKPYGSGGIDGMSACGPGSSAAPAPMRSSSNRPFRSGPRHRSRGLGRMLSPSVPLSSPTHPGNRTIKRQVHVELPLT
jgi:hypothetical protein